MNFKKIAMLLMALMLLFTLAACGDNKKETSAEAGSSAQTSTSAEASSDAETSSTAEAGSGTEAGSGATSTTSAEGASDTTEKKRTIIEDMELTATDGTTVKLSALAKENTILVFWATWCHFCVKEIPILEELAKEHDNLSIVMINTGEAKDTVAAFEKANNLQIKTYYDEKSEIARKFGITGFPSNMFLSEELELIAFVSGKLEKKEFEDAFTKIKEFRTNRGDFNQ